MIFQSTLPRRKWPPAHLHNKPGWKISIHTSAKEVTTVRQSESASGIFQSTLPRRKWRRCPEWTWFFRNFNPHFREGSDTNRLTYLSYWRYFNPHFREGSDYLILPIENTAWNFNPHFREGSDAGAQNGLDYSGISIHTSAKEVTVWQAHSHFLTWFQSTLPRRKWLFPLLKSSRYTNFNPHFREGSDLKPSNPYANVPNFNPHFREGSDRSICL